MNFLSKLIHSKIITHLKKLQLEPTHIATFNLQDADFFELRTLYPTAHVQHDLLSGEGTDLFILDLSLITTVDLQHLFSLIEPLFNDDGFMMIVTLNHLSKKLIAEHAPDLLKQINTDEKIIASYLTKNPAFSFFVKEETVITLGKNEEPVICDFFFVAKENILSFRKDLSPDEEIKEEEGFLTEKDRAEEATEKHEENEDEEETEESEDEREDEHEESEKDEEHKDEHEETEKDEEHEDEREETEKDEYEDKHEEAEKDEEREDEREETEKDEHEDEHEGEHEESEEDKEHEDEHEESEEDEETEKDEEDEEPEENEENEDEYEESEEDEEHEDEHEKTEEDEELEDQHEQGEESEEPEENEHAEPANKHEHEETETHEPKQEDQRKELKKHAIKKDLFNAVDRALKKSYDKENNYQEVLDHQKEKKEQNNDNEEPEEKVD